MSNGKSYIYTIENFKRDFGISEVYDASCDYYFDPPEVENKDKNVDEIPRQLLEKGVVSSNNLILQLNNAHWRGNSKEVASCGNRKFLTGNDKVLLYIIRKIIFPANNKDNKLTKANLYLLGALKHNVKLNLPKLIFRHMEKSLENKKCSNLPYGGLVTKIMLQWGINIGESSEVSQIPKVINEQTYIKQKSILVNNRDIINRDEVRFLDGETQRLYREALEVRQALRGAHMGDSEEDEEQNEIENEVQNEPMDEVPLGRVSLEERIARLEQTQQRILESQQREERRNGKMRKLLRTLAKACGCSDVDIQESLSSPEA